MCKNQEDMKRRICEHTDKVIKRKGRLSRLEESIIEVPLTVWGLDETGKYLPFCELPAHEGIIRNESDCHKRDCRFKTKLYFPRKK